MTAPARAFNRMVTVEHLEPRPDGGRPEVVSTETVRANLQPTPSTEDTSGRDLQAQAWNGYFPAGVRLEGWDRVRLGAMELELNGPGRVCFDFAGAEHHVEARLVRVR